MKIQKVYLFTAGIFVMLLASGCIVDEELSKNRFCLEEVDMYIPEKYSNKGFCYDENNEILFSIFNRGESTIEKIKYTIIDGNETFNGTIPVQIPYNELKVIGIKKKFKDLVDKDMYITPITYYNITGSEINCSTRTEIIRKIEKC